MKHSFQERDDRKTLTFSDARSQLIAKLGQVIEFSLGLVSLPYPTEYFGSTFSYFIGFSLSRLRRASGRPPLSSDPLCFSVSFRQLDSLFAFALLQPTLETIQKVGLVHF